jgi:hypothetical protein
MSACIDPHISRQSSKENFPVATKKTPAAKSTRSKRTTAASQKKTPKKASPKKRPPKVQSASSARSTSKKTTAKSVKNNKKSAKQRIKPIQATQISKVGAENVKVDRRRAGGRRGGDGCESAQVEDQPKLERRKKVQRRRQIDPTTCERDYSLEEVEFMSALDDYKRKSGRMFPTCSEILEVIHSIGYIKLSNAELVARGGSQQQQSMEVEEDSVGPEDLPKQRKTGDRACTESAHVELDAQTAERQDSIPPWSI